MAEAETEDIKEGFICPICHINMRSPNNLITHFQDLHSEEQDVLKSLKDLFGKAKKILKLEEQEQECNKAESHQKYYLEQSQPQEPGHSRTHIDYFKSIRRERLDHSTTETNKLIIRLDRLLKVFGSDRKQHEQELVTWLDGSVVNRCPSCAACFNITRRQHHCRLCGSIMCHSCSYFLSYDVAQTIVAPVYNREVNSRDNMAYKPENDNLRICNHCMNMLESRRQAQIAQMVQPVICQLYSHLQKIKVQLQPSIDSYQKMYKSLISGDTVYQLQDAQSLHAYLAKQAETLDTISKKIASLPVENDPQQKILQNNIRNAISNYIKEYLITLPVLPTQSELEKLKEERLLEYSKLTPEPVQPNIKIKKIAITTGWSPANVNVNENPTETFDDPLEIQIQIVENYIEQAKLAHRSDEVQALCDNLRLLQREQKLNRQKRQKHVQN